MTGLYIEDMDRPLTVTITGLDDELRVIKFAGNDFAALMASNTGNAKEATFGNALYHYGEVAKAYFDGQ